MTWEHIQELNRLYTSDVKAKMWHTFEYDYMFSASIHDLTGIEVPKSWTVT